MHNKLQVEVTVSAETDKYIFTELACCELATCWTGSTNCIENTHTDTTHCVVEVMGVAWFK